MIDRVLPRVLKRLTGDAVPVAQRDRLRPIFDAPQYVIAQLTYLCLLMTFGAVFPPLAVALAVTMIGTATFTRLKVGRLLTHAQSQKFAGYEAIVEAECANVASSSMLLRSMWFIVHLSAAFYALFLFDTLGDVEGFGGAYWVLIVIPMLPAVVYCAYYVLQKVIFAKNEALADQCASKPPAASLEVLIRETGDISLTDFPHAAQTTSSNTTLNVLHRDSDPV